MQPSTDTRRSTEKAVISTRRAPKPMTVLLIATAVVFASLLVTLSMPIGPMYWDQYIYLDAANRILGGQIPSVDFFAPAGGLGYYLFALFIHVFPKGHPLLLASWSLLAVSVPLMAIVIRDVQKRSVPIAYALLLPFLLFSILPFNTGDFYPFPGSDGFGIYNRQVCQLLYVLAAALLHVRDQRKLAVVVALAMLALLFVKVTGVAAGVVLCLTAFAAGRLHLRAAVLAGLIFFGVIAVLELSSGVVSAYAADIFALLDVNDTSLLPRLIQAASLNFGLVLASGVLCLVLARQGFAVLRENLKCALENRNVATLSKVFDHPAFWLAAFIAAGLLFESQNTGSQAFIFLWPLLVVILVENNAGDRAAPSFLAVSALVLAVAAPPAVIVVQKASRAWIGTINSEALDHRHLSTMGAVRIRDLQIQRAERMRKSYVEDRKAYDALARSGELPSFLLYSDYEFQTLWLLSADDAVQALHRYEAANGVRFDTIMNIDFTNPFPWLMDRRAPKYIAIGADPYRAVPVPNAKVSDAVRTTDIALYPTCPPTTARLKLLELYEPILAAGHTRIALTPCFDAFVRNDLATTR